MLMVKNQDGKIRLPINLITGEICTRIGSSDFSAKRATMFYLQANNLTKDGVKDAFMQVLNSDADDSDKKLISENIEQVMLDFDKVEAAVKLKLENL